MGRREETSHDSVDVIDAALESSVVPRGFSLGDHVPERAPPWSVVRDYLESGEHGAWVDAHAARSAAFADVLRALRHDWGEAKRGVVVSMDRARGR